MPVFPNKSTNSEFLPKRTTPVPSQDFPARVSQPAFNSTSYTLSNYESIFTSAISTEVIFQTLTVFHLLKESASFYETAKHVPTDRTSPRYLTLWQLIRSSPSISIFLNSLLMLSSCQGSHISSVLLPLEIAIKWQPVHARYAVTWTKKTNNSWSTYSYYLLSGVNHYVASETWN